MIINGAWYVDQLPTMIVVELTDRTLKMFHLTPFRQVTETDLQDYKGHHPRKMKGQPLPEYLYRFYEFEKNSETASEVVMVRLTPTEKEKVIEKAGGKSISEFIRSKILSEER